VFSYDKMLAMSGNTATYMQYAYARVRSIFAKGNVDLDALPRRRGADPVGLAGRKGVGRRTAPFCRGLDMTAADYRPNQLTSYLFDLANRYSTFFEQCHVLRAAGDELRQSRLLLCDLTARTIQRAWSCWGSRWLRRCEGEGDGGGCRETFSHCISVLPTTSSVPSRSPCFGGIPRGEQVRRLNG